MAAPPAGRFWRRPDLLRVQAIVVKSSAQLTPQDPEFETRVRDSFARQRFMNR